MKKIKFLLVLVSLLVFVQCEKPSLACFTMSSTTAYVYQSVTFTSCSSCKNCSNHNTVSDLQWDFGDGSKAYGGTTITHGYSAPGQYHVTLTSNDADNDAKASVSQTITIIKRSDLSRNGKFISFTSNADGDYDIYLAQVDANGNLATSGLIFSSNPYNLTNSFNTLADRESNWSPDGRALIFSARLASGEENIYAFFFNANGTLVSASPTIVIAQSAAWDDNAGFSPDGKYIVFDRRVDQNSTGLDSADNRDLYMASITLTASSITVNGALTQLTSTSNVDEGNPKWSPLISVQRVAYERPPTPNANDHDIYILDPLNPSVTNYDYNNPGSSGYPAWAPDCNTIIFETNSGNGGFYKIVNASYPNNSGTTDVAQSSSQDYRYPTLLPNGGLVAYIQLSGGKGNIYIVPVNGGTSTKLLPASFDNADNIFPAW